MADVFAHVRQLHPDWDATFSIGGKNKYVPLQCADIIAFEGNRQMQMTPNFYAKRRMPLQAIDPIGNRFGYLKYTADEVRPMADFIVDRLKKLAEEDGFTFSH